MKDRKGNEMQVRNYWVPPGIAFMVIISLSHWKILILCIMFAAGFITWLYLNAAFRLHGLNAISYL